MKTIQTWQEWLARWNDPEITEDERPGLLHIGGRFIIMRSLNIDVLDHYLYVAKTGVPLSSDILDREKKMQTRIKAKAVLTKHFFTSKEGYGSRNLNLFCYIDKGGLVSTITDFLCSSPFEYYNVELADPKEDEGKVSTADRELSVYFLEFYKMVYAFYENHLNRFANEPWYKGPLERNVAPHRFRLLKQVFMIAPWHLLDIKKDGIDKSHVQQLIWDIIGNAEGQFGMQFCDRSLTTIDMVEGSSKLDSCRRRPWLPTQKEVMTQLVLKHL